MKLKSSIKKVGLVVFALVIVAITTVSCSMLSEINFSLGAHTKVVNASQFKRVEGKLAIKNTSVLSADSDTMLPNKTVLISNKKIEAITEGNQPIPNDYHIIDGTNKYLIPGLIDSHVHLKKSKNDLLLYLANGITYVGEMTGMKEHFKYAEDVANGTYLGPRIYIASPKVNSKKGIKATLRSWFERRHQNYSTEKAARRAVRKYKEKGYKAIKLSSELFNRDIYFAINDEAKKQGIPVIGHLPAYVYMDDLYTSGQSQLSHIQSITQSEMNEYGGVDHTNAEAFLEYFKAKADSIAIKLKENNITISSTLWINEVIPEQDFYLSEFLKTIPLEYMNPGWVEGSKVSGGWLPGSGNSYENPNNTDAESMAKSKVYWDTQIEALQIITSALIKYGVVITAGTDAHGAAGCIPGFSLHDELAALHRFGMSNAQIIHSATTATAQWMDITTGTIEVGYDADIVLLNKNPLDNIANTKTINAVIADGTYFNKATLNNMLTKVKQANNESRNISIDPYIND